MVKVNTVVEENTTNDHLLIGGETRYGNANS